MTYRPISVALIFVTVLFTVTDASQAKTFAPATFEGLLRIVDAVAIADVTALKGLGSDEMTDVSFSNVTVVATRMKNEDFRRIRLLGSLEVRSEDASFPSQLRTEQGVLELGKRYIMFVHSRPYNRTPFVLSPMEVLSDGRIMCDDFAHLYYVNRVQLTCARSEDVASPPLHEADFVSQLRKVWDDASRMFPEFQATPYGHHIHQPGANKGK